MADAVPTAGTMVAAVLETAGYHFQAHILDNFTGAFTGSLGGFIYVVGVAFTIFAMAIRGGFRFGPWLLIGPPLFFSMVLPRTDIEIVNWRFAQQDRDNARVRREVARMLDGDTAPARVSTLFARYTRLISATTQEMVKVINKDKTETDKWFILKGQLLSRFYARNAENPGLQQLIQFGLFKLCGDKVAAAKILRDLRFPERQRRSAQEAMERWDTERFKLVSRDAAKAVADLRGAANNGQGAAGQSSDINTILEETFTCKDIWHYVYEGLLREGHLTRLRAEQDAIMNGVNGAKTATQIAKAMGIIDPGATNVGTVNEAEVQELLARAAAKFILRNESYRNSFAGRLEETAGLSREYDTVESPVENELAQTELARGRSTEWAEKSRLMTAASNLPYFQGLLLYFLGVAFPFFAMLLLVPGKHGAFIMWFILWLWIKSWDVAMAIVMQLDDILFSLMSLSHRFHQDPLQVAKLQDDFQLAILALRETDPTFQMTTYYNVIALCLLAIPPVTSQLILGSLNGGAGLVSAGMRSMSDVVGGGSERVQSQPGIANARHQHQELAMNRMQLYFRNRLGAGYVKEDPVSHRATRETFGFQQLASDGKGGFVPGAKNDGVHVHYGPETQYTSSSRYGDNARYSIAQKQELANFMSTYQGFFGAVGGRPETNKTLRSMLVAKGVNPRNVTSTIKELGQAFSKGAEGGLGAVASYLNSTSSAELKALAASAEVNAAYERQAKHYAAAARGHYTQLEVPWAPTNVQEVAETDMELTFLMNQQNAEAALIKSVGGVVEDSMSAITKRRPTTPDREDTDWDKLED